MSTPEEKGHSLLMCRQFLRELAFGNYKGAPKHVRNVARMCLRHFPWDSDLYEFAKSCPEHIQIPSCYEAEKGDVQ